MTAAQKWDVPVCVLSTERPCDWGDLAEVGATVVSSLLPVPCFDMVDLFVSWGMFVVSARAQNLRFPKGFAPKTTFSFFSA